MSLSQERIESLLFKHISKRSGDVLVQVVRQIIKLRPNKSFLDPVANKGLDIGKTGPPNRSRPLSICVTSAVGSSENPLLKPMWTKIEICSTCSF